MGAVGLPFGTLATGWGIPTATDISVAWVVAYTVFGAGHPAINFLLLCAIIDDGIGLVIIAVVYREENPDPEPEPVYLLLVGVAMLMDPEEEDLEEVIVQNMEHALRRIHRVEHRCERKHGISRHQSLVIMNGLPKNSSDSKLQVKPRKRSPSPQPLPVQGMKRNQSSEALIDQLIEKHIRKNEASPPPPPPLTDTPRVAGRPPRPLRARSVGSLQSGSPPSA